MEAATEMLEAKFQKADSDLNHLTRKLELRCQDHAEGDSRRNPLELLHKVKVVKDEYKALVQEAAEIKKAQAEVMDFFRSQLPIAMQALQQLQQQVGMGGSEEDKVKVEELQNLLGIQAPATLAPACQAQPCAQTAENGGRPPEPVVSDVDGGCAEPSAAESQAMDDNASVCKVPEDPVVSRAALRAESSELVEVSQEEFETVSELIRGRVKLSDVNVVYRSLFKYFKEEGNRQALSVSDMHKMGMRVSGATGQAKLKVLRALKLLSISSKGEVKLL